MATNTTLCVVALDASLSRQALAQVARAATAALHARITPVGTAFDGDIVYAVCPIPPQPVADDPARALQAESIATLALEAAIESAVRNAVGRDGIPGLADRIS
jgi:L-aminopeptidase/D-esterase-like protein